METIKALALAVAIGFPLLVLLSMLMDLLIRTQHKWRKLPRNPALPLGPVAPRGSRFSK